MIGRFRVCFCTSFTFFLVGCSSPKNTIIGWGDSMMKGSGSEISIMEVISSELNVAHENFGVGGFWSKQVAVLQGAHPLYLKAIDSVIPASGEVILQPIDIEPFNHFGRQERDGYLGTLSGTLERIHTPQDRKVTKHYIFDRDFSILEAPMPDPVVYEFEEAREFRKYMTIFWVGRNDDHSGDKSLQTLENIQDMVNYLEGAAKEKYLILSVCNGIADSEGIGTTPHTRIKRMNALLKERFGNHFIDVRSYLIKHALTDLNIAPTEQDQKDIAKDCIPRSLFFDHVHLNELGNEAVGKFLAKTIKEKGWLE